MAIKVKEKAEVSTNVVRPTNRPKISAQDIILAKILPQQFSSEKVKSKESQAGEFRDTLENRLFANPAEEFEFIPFHVTKFWLEYDLVAQKNGTMKREYKQKVDMTPTNEGLAMSEPGLERDRVMEFFCLIPEDVAAGTPFPFVLSFKRSSLNAGKQLMMQMYVKNEMAKKEPCAVVMKLKADIASKDNQDYFVQKLRASRSSTSEEIKEALTWENLLGQTSYKVDDSDDVKPELGAQPAFEGNF